MTINERTREIIAGISIIAAYGVSGSMFTADKDMILGLEFASGIAVILAAVMLYPRFASVWGTGALGPLFTANVFEHAGAPLSFGVLFFLPIVANEVFLAAWLIIKGLQLPIVC